MRNVATLPNEPDLTHANRRTNALEPATSAPLAEAFAQFRTFVCHAVAQLWIAGLKDFYE
jgi:hypothetical protein